MFGSNSAPHQKENKECHHGAAGVFNSPIALQLLTELFEKNGKLDNLNAFVSLNAQRIYNLKPTSKSITLIKKDFTVPDIYSYKNEQVVPMFAGKNLLWSIE